MSETTFEKEISEYKKYPDLGVDFKEVTAGRHKIKEASEANVEASDAEISSKVWFRSPVRVLTLHPVPLRLRKLTNVAANSAAYQPSQ
jgi:hypothetical protein